MTPINPPPPGSGARDAALSSVIVNSGYGGLHATILSAFALVLSAFSLYEASFKTAELEIFIPPVIQYGRDGGGDTELFVVPITVTNSGARTGTVLSMELSVEDLKSKRVKRYYSAFLGEHQIDPDAPNRSFAPLSIAGKGTFSDTVRFYPVGNPLPKLAEEAGDYRFTLSLVTAMPTRPDFVDRVLRRQAGTGRLRADAAVGLRPAARLATHHDLHAREGVERRACGGDRGTWRPIASPACASIGGAAARQ